MIQARFESRWANVVARIVITLGAIALFFVICTDAFALTKKYFLLTYQREIATPKIIENYLQHSQIRKLQIGAGASHLQGWLNTDINPLENQAYVDATRKTLFPDGSIQYIFGEHVIEHLSYADGLAFLKEAHRILSPGGKIRLVTPDLLQFAAMLQAETPEQRAAIARYVPRKLEFHFWKETPDDPCFIINQEMKDFGHQFVYTPAMLRARLQEAGFTEIRQYKAGETEDPALKGVELRPNGAYADMNAYEAMAFEATR